MNSREFRAYVVTKRGFPAQNSSDNGERARSLLCGREALAKPPGAAVYLLTLFYPAFVGSAWKRENILRQGYLLTSKVSATTLIAAAVVFLRPKPNVFVHHLKTAMIVRCVPEAEVDHAA